MSEVRTHEVVLEQLNGVTSDYGRAVVRYFDYFWSDAATVDELTAYIHDRKPSDRDEARIRIQLHHVTLPKLEDGGLIDYDSETNVAHYRWDSQVQSDERSQFDVDE